MLRRTSHFTLSLLPQVTASSSDSHNTTSSSTSQDATPWLGVLLEILMKLCDTRASDVCLEPELNSVPTKETYKKKSNGLRRLKGPDVGTEEWGNLSDDMGNGSDDSEEEYSSSDESEEGTYILIPYLLPPKHTHIHIAILRCFYCLLYTLTDVHQIRDI